MDKKITGESVLKNDLIERIQLLSRGIIPPAFNGKLLTKLFSKGVGAGPQGKTFHLLTPETQKFKSMISVPVFLLDHHLSAYALKTTLGEIPGTLKTENGSLLKSPTIPKFINKKIEQDITALQTGIATIHCYKTCSSVLSTDCIHFINDQPCRYCEIKTFGKKPVTTLSDRAIAQYSKVIQLAREHDQIRSLTITSGTFTDPDQVARQYIKLLTHLKDRVNIPVHIQIEPVQDQSLIKELSYLAQSIGIFLEIFDEEVRKKICPGKAGIPLSRYQSNWQSAVKTFGRGNVATTCLLGFGIDYEQILNQIEKFAQLGVKTSLLFVRCKSRQLENYIPTYLNRDLSEIVDLFMRTAQILANNHIAYDLKNGSGCISCQGCTAMVESCQYIKNNPSRP